MGVVHLRKEGDVAPLIPDEADKKRPMNVLLPEEIWERLDMIVEKENARRQARAAANGAKKKPRQLSRSGLVEYFLNWAIDDYWKQAALLEDRPGPSDSAKPKKK